MITDLFREIDLTALNKKSQEKLSIESSRRLIESCEVLKENFSAIEPKGVVRLKESIDYSKLINKKVKFIGNVISYTETEYISYQYEDEEENIATELIPFINVKLLIGNKEINTLVVSGREKVDLFLTQVNKSKQVLVYGKIINFPTKNSTFKPTLYIKKVKEASNPLDLIEITKEEKTELENFLNKNKNLKTFIRNELIELTGLTSLNKSEELSTTLDFIVLQALSDGVTTRTSQKLHSLLIGAPASGKKLISKAIEILNPRFIEVGVGKVTLAGISASTTLKDNEWTSKPGALIKAHKGALVCQDFHTISKTNFDQIMGVLSVAMEDAKIHDSTTANIEHLAETSIHLDINKQSDLKDVGDISYHEDIQNIPINILTRFDYINEIEGSNKRQQAIAINMFDKKDSKISTKVKEKRVRFLKLLIAYLRNTFKDVAINKKTREKLKSLHLELQGDNIHVEELGAFQTRAVNSAIKLVIAHARLNQRSTSKELDAYEAYRYIQKKFKVVGKIIPSFLAIEGELQGNVLTTKQRRDWIKSNYPQKKIKVKDLKKSYYENFQMSSDAALQKALYRDMEKIAIDVGHGKFKIK